MASEAGPFEPPAESEPSEAGPAKVHVLHPVVVALFAIGCTGLVGSILGAVNWLMVGRPVRAIVVLGWGTCGVPLLTSMVMQSNEVPQQILSTATVSLVLLLDQVDLQRQHRPLSGGWRTWVLGALAALLACNMSLGMLINAAGWNAPPPPVEAPVVGP